MKNLVCIIQLLFIAGTIRAQQDSSQSSLNLNEVIISKEGKENGTEAFNFYRSSKIAGTEEILSRMEGVNMIRRGAFGMEPTLRTYSAGQINVTLNGMKMYGACTDKMDPVTAYVEPVNLNALSVQQGAGGSMKGSTIGGGLDMQLKEATFYCHKVLQVNVFSQFNTNNSGTSNGFVLNTNSKTSSVRVNGVYRLANDYYAGGGTLVEHSGYEKMNVNLSFVQKLGKVNELIVDGLADRGLNMGYPALPMDVKQADAIILSLAHRLQPAKGYIKKWENKIYYNQVTHRMDDTHRKETFMHMDMPGESATMGFYSELNMLHGRHQVLLRADGHQAFTRAEMTMYPSVGKPMYMQTLPGNYLTNGGFSTAWNYAINRNLMAGIQTRFDFYQQVVTDTFGILQWKGFGTNVRRARTDVLKNFSVYAEHRKGFSTQRLSFSYGERLPTGNERLGFYLFNRMDGYDYIGRYDLMSEQALQAEYKYMVQTKNMQVSGVVFYHVINNYIYSSILNGWSAMTYGGRGVKQYFNLNRAYLTGLELAGSYRFSQRIQYNGNLRYTYATLSNSKPMQQVPPMKLVNTLRYQRAAFQVQVEHTGAFNQSRINADFGETVTNGYNGFNMRTAYMKKYGKVAVQLNAAIENIFDLKYREHLDWGGVARMGRNVAVGVNVYLN